MAAPESRIAELGAGLVVAASLVLATVFLSVQGLKGADDKPLNGGDTSPGASSTVSSTVTTDPASDLYLGLTPCDNFSDPLAESVPGLDEELPVAVQQSTDTEDRCIYAFPDASTLSVVVTWFPADAERAGHQIATADLEARAGSVLGSPRIGTASKIACEEGACTLTTVHHDLLVEFALTVIEKDRQSVVQPAVIRIAGDYASTNFR